MAERLTKDQCSNHEEPLVAVEIITEVVAGYIIEVCSGPEHLASLLVGLLGEAHRALPMIPLGTIVILQESATPDARFLSAQSLVKSLTRADQRVDVRVLARVYCNCLNDLSGSAKGSPSWQINRG